MQNLLPLIRNVPRAVIFKNRQLLVLKKTDGSYALPGGAMAVHETLTQALQRECEEEIGCCVTVHQLLFVADYFKTKRTTPPDIQHQIEFLFLCKVADDYVPQNGKHPDKRQIEVQWLDLAQLAHISMPPDSIKTLLNKIFSYSKLHQPASNVYAGNLK